MPLNKTDLNNEIASILQDMLQRENTSIDEFANRLSSAIDNYVKDADIIYEGGLTNAGGAVTGIFNGSLE